MNPFTNKIALLTQADNVTGIANASLLTIRGFRVAITGSRQKELATAVGSIGHGSLGLLSDPANACSLLSVYEKVSCYFKGPIDLLLVGSLPPWVGTGFDLTRAFFTVQCAVPYLNEDAAVILQSDILTGNSLDAFLNDRSEKDMGISVFLGSQSVSPGSQSANFLTCKN
jgi:hypothetical protein